MSYVGNRPNDVIGVRSGGSNPSSGSIGELFYNTVSQSLVVWSGVAWTEVSGASIVPTGNALPGAATTGQLFYLTTEDKPYVYDGTVWAPLIGSPAGSTLPGSANAGDTFFNTTTQTLYLWNGSAWTPVGGGSTVNHGAVTPPTGSDVGDLFYNTVAQSLLLWDGSSWEVVTTVNSSLVPTGPTNPGSATDGAVFYNTSENILYARVDGEWVSIMPGATNSAGSLPVNGEIGQLFFNTGDGNVYVWDGADWVLVGGANSGSGVVVGPTLPGSAADGDLFYQTLDDTLYVWSVSAWVSLMGGGTGVVVGSTLPGSGNNGDLFYLTTNNELYFWSDIRWVSLVNARSPSGTSFPSSPSTGDIFYNTADGTLYLWNGAAWVPMGGGTSTGIAVDTSVSVTGTPTTSLGSVFTAPATSARRYILSSLQASNISGNMEAITADINYVDQGHQLSVGNKIPLPAGSAIELLKSPKVLNPNDMVRLASTNNGAISVSATYSVSTDTKLFGTGAALTTNAATDVYVATAKSRIDSILISNMSESDSVATISWTNSTNAVQTYFVYDIIVPANSTIEVLEASKIIPNGHKIRAQSTYDNTINVLVSGKIA